MNSTEWINHTSTNKTFIFAGGPIIAPLYYTVLVLGFGSFGIFGNILTLTVLFKKKHWNSVNTIIVLMSLSDLLGLIVFMAVPIQFYLGKPFQNVNAYLQDTFTSSSCLCAVIIALERSFAVRKPLKFREIWNTKLTIKIYIAFYSIALALVAMRCAVTEILGRDYFRFNFYLAYFILLRITSFAIILVANILIIRGLFNNSKLMKGMVGQDNDRKRIKTESAITKTVVAITTIYFLCMIPSRVSVGLSHAGVPIDGSVFFIQIITEVVNLSVDVVVYTATSKFFKTEYIIILKSVFSCLRRNLDKGKFDLEAPTSMTDMTSLN